MVIRKSGMKTNVMEKMRGGTGNTSILHLVNCENEKNIRLLSEITLLPGCSIGNHGHENESEYFFILSGNGTVNDNGTDFSVSPGDATITESGASHSISNTGTVPLVFLAVIVTY